jgi:hypothetical protein
MRMGFKINHLVMQVTIQQISTNDYTIITIGIIETTSTTKHTNQIDNTIQIFNNYKTIDNTIKLFNNNNIIDNTTIIIKRMNNFNKVKQIGIIINIKQKRIYISKITKDTQQLYAKSVISLVTPRDFVR